MQRTELAGIEDGGVSAHPEEYAGRSPATFAYLLQIFPKYSETFILNELLEHQRQGSSIRVLSLRLPREGRFHGCLATLRQAAEYVAESFWDKPGIIGEAAFDALRQVPGGVARTGGHWLGRHATARDLWQAMLVRRWARRRGVTHFHTHFGGYAATVAYLSRLMGGPSYSVTLHAFDIFRNSVNRDLLRRIIAQSAFTVTVSQFNAVYLRDQVMANPSKVRVLYNGIPLERFPYSDAKREPASILSVGRLIEKKGFLHLIRACGLLAKRGLPIRCDIVGEGPQKDALKAEIRKLGLQGVIRLVGAWPQERVAQALSHATLFVLPCVEAKDGNMDALPTVLLEAMAAGCPCVSTRLSGIPEIIVDEQSGLLVAPEDDASLAKSIGRLLDHPADAARLAREGRNRVEKIFDVRQNVSVLATWLREASSANQHRVEKVESHTGVTRVSLPQDAPPEGVPA